MRKTIVSVLLYGAGFGLLAVLLYWGKYRLLIVEHAFELYALLIGVVFVVVGAWLGKKLSRPKTIIEERVVIREVPALPQPESKLFFADGVADTSDISPRERDVLLLLAKGLSNAEIAAELFVSQNTVKTHLSSLYFKLDVKRRTQAVEKARTLGLLAGAPAVEPIR